ncbi:hypothetical protein N7456_006982 [Penicillium angulare]|uniref:Uncharacterized protein n=1 Tax=Penicillium angulare TaxID=116970 RepID=A0A9W9FIU0_9EURO|nr:hypothetical protein N7456_006982 [Penicillium angulare]
MAEQAIHIISGRGSDITCDKTDSLVVTMKLGDGTVIEVEVGWLNARPPGHDYGTTNIRRKDWWSAAQLSNGSPKDGWLVNLGGGKPVTLVGIKPRLDLERSVSRLLAAISNKKKRRVSEREKLPHPSEAPRCWSYADQK